MGQVSRPMQIALLATVVFAMAWFLVLRPKEGGGSAAATPAPTTTAPGVGGLASARDKAQGAVQASQRDADAKSADADGDGVPRAPSSAPTASGPSANGATGTAPTSTSSTVSPAGRPSTVPARRDRRGLGGPARAARALAARKVLAVLFYNRRASDDRAVRAEFRHIGRRGGRVVTVAAPLSRLSAYRAVTSRVAVTGSPTVVIFDRAGSPTTLVGFADRAELNARVADALASGGRVTPPATP